MSRPLGVFSSIRVVVYALLLWATLSLLLHLGWEIIQLPLYTLGSEPEALYVAWAIFHCTLGDGLIASASFLVVSACLGRLDWPMRTPLRGLPILLVSGVAYTVFSEWHNVYRLGSWAYADAMPTIWGIGVAPIVQWIFVPVLTLWIYVRFHGTGGSAGLSRGVEHA